MKYRFLLILFSALLLPVFSLNATSRSFNSGEPREVYPRRMVVEEGTGTWCPWCVRGIVGLEEMTRNYPDNFIGIAIHANDEMDFSSKYGLPFTSYPSAYFNRSVLSDPSYYTMERFLDNQSGLMIDVMVKINSITFSDDYREMTVSTNTRFGYGETDADYRLAYVITEDGVGPYAQFNKYAGSSGEMGGFENLPSPTPVVFNDVARGIYPSLTGVEGCLPATISACTDYSYEYTFQMPKNCDNYSNLKLTVLLYDAVTGEIVNADRMKCPEGQAPSYLIIDMAGKPGTLASKLGDEIYDTQRLAIKGEINGADLATLANMMGCGSSEGHLLYLDLSNARIVKGGEYLKYGQYSILKEDDCLPEGAFSENKTLRFIAMPSSLRKICDNALVNSHSIQEIKLNEGLAEIGGDAFAFNWSSRGSLKKINIPSTVSSIHPTFLSGCNKVDIVFDHRNKYYSYDNIALYSKDFNEFIMVSPLYNGIFTVNDNCTFINIGILGENIPGLIATNVREIGSLVGDENLEFMALGYPLESLGYYVFYGMNNLTNIYLGCSNVPKGTYRYSEHQFENASNCTLYVPSASIETFKADSFWNQMKDIKPIEGTKYEYLKNIGTSVDPLHPDDKCAKEIYTLDGRSVSKMPSKGVYVVNGKKIFVK